MVLLGGSGEDRDRQAPLVVRSVYHRDICEDPTSRLLIIDGELSLCCFGDREALPGPRGGHIDESGHTGCSPRADRSCEELSGPNGVVQHTLDLLLCWDVYLVSKSLDRSDTACLRRSDEAL